MIRIATEADIPAILAIYGPYVLESTATFEYEVPSLEAFTGRFRTFTAQLPWLVWEEGGEILGYAYASPPFSRAAYSWCSEPTVYLRPDARGRGIGQKLYAALEAILAKQGYQVLYALICDENHPSLRFHEKQGYREVGHLANCGFKFGRWMGIVWMEKRLKPVEIPSNLPCSCLSIMQMNQSFFDILDTLSLS